MGSIQGRTGFQQLGGIIQGLGDFAERIEQRGNKVLAGKHIRMAGNQRVASLLRAELADLGLLEE